MCGLTGFLSLNAFTTKNQYSDKRNFAKQMLLFNSLRGMDSTGVALCGQKNNGISLYKRAVPSHDFLQLRRTDQILTDIDNCTVFLGHTRSKTHGPVGDDEAHPFTYGHITMIHNGSVGNYRSLTNNCDVETDSAYIACSMAEQGAKETLEMLNGAFCIVWYDAKEQTFSFARNKERPLYFVEVPEWDGLAFASEMGMLATALDRNYIKTKGKFWYPEEYQILTWSAKPGAKLEYKSVPFVDRRLSQPKAAPITHGTNSSHPAHNTTATDLTRQQIGTNAKHMAPNSKRSVAKATERLKKYGIFYGSVYSCFLETFIPYPKSNGGGMGCLCLRPSSSQLVTKSVHMHNVKNSVFQKIKNSKFAHLVSIVNVKKISGKEVLVAVPAPYGQLTALIEAEKRGAPSSTEGVKTAIKKLFDDDPPHEDCDTCVDNQGARQPGPGLYLGPNNKYYPRDVWEEMTMDGCVVCNSDMNPDDHAEGTTWVGNFEENPICPECSKDKALLTTLGLYYKNQETDSQKQKLQ